MATLIVGIPAHQEWNHIGKTLESIWHSQLPPNTTLKIIVCANDSNKIELKRLVKETKKEAERLGIPFNQLTILEESISSKPNAINHIFEHPWVRDSETRFVSLMDGDVRIQPTALGKLIHELEHERTLEGVGASGTPSSIAKLSQAMAHVPHKVARFKYLQGGCLLLRQSSISEIGKIPLGVISDDLFISLKLGKNRIRRVKGAEFVLHPPATFKELFEQARRQWTGVVQLQKIFGKQKVDELVNPKIWRAFKRGIKTWKSLSKKERLALLLAPGFYMAVKAVSRIKRNQNGTWKRQPSTKRPLQ